MDRKHFFATTGLLGLGTVFSNSLFGKERKERNPVKEKIVLKDEGKQLNCLGDHQLIKLTGKDKHPNSPAHPRK